MLVIRKPCPLRREKRNLIDGLRSNMKRQPTQIEEKPKADMGIRRRKKRRRPLVMDIDIEEGDPPTKIDLDKIGFWDTNEYPFDFGDDDKYPSTVEFEPHKCLICGRIATHGTPFCPYKKFVPHNVTLPPGIQRVCTCCGKIDGHPGTDWEGCAVIKMCRDCGVPGKHWTGDPDCPTKTGKPIPEDVPDSPTDTGSPLDVEMPFGYGQSGKKLWLP